MKDIAPNYNPSLVFKRLDRGRMFSVLYDVEYEGDLYTGVQFFPDAQLFLIYLSWGFYVRDTVGDF